MLTFNHVPSFVIQRCRQIYGKSIMKLFTKEKGIIFPCQPRNERKNKGLDLLDNIDSMLHTVLV